MLSFFPLDVLGEFCDVISVSVCQFQRDVLPTLNFTKYNYSGSTTKGQIDERIGKKNKKTNKKTFPITKYSTCILVVQWRVQIEECIGKEKTNTLYKNTNTLVEQKRVRIDECIGKKNCPFNKIQIFW